MAPQSQAASSSPVIVSAPLQNAANDTLTPDDENEMSEQALYVSISVVQQAVSFLDSSNLTPEQLSYASKLLPGGSIGKHLRHATDHWKLLLNAMTASPGAPVTLSYDVRIRNTAVETSVQAARDCLQQVIEILKEVVTSTALDTPITLHAITPFPATMNTTFGRELWFASLHAIHHWSMLRVIAGEQGISVEESFGVAPSTLMYRGRASNKTKL